MGTEQRNFESTAHRLSALCATKNIIKLASIENKETITTHLAQTLAVVDVREVQLLELDCMGVAVYRCTAPAKRELCGEPFALWAWCRFQIDRNTSGTRESPL